MEAFCWSRAHSAAWPRSQEERQAVSQADRPRARKVEQIPREDISHSTGGHGGVSGGVVGEGTMGIGNEGARSFEEEGEVGVVSEEGASGLSSVGVTIITEAGEFSGMGREESGRWRSDFFLGKGLQGSGIDGERARIVEEEVTNAGEFGI